MSDEHREGMKPLSDQPEGEESPHAGEDPSGPPTPPQPPIASSGSVPPDSPPGPTPTRPADYYAQPPASPEAKSGCGKWALGCGAAGCLVGILMIAGFVWFAKSGWPLMMSRMVVEVEKHIDRYGEEIDPSVREELRVELDELRRHIEQGDVKLQDMESIVYSIQDVIGDEQISTAEAEEFVEDLRRVNDIGASGEF